MKSFKSKQRENVKNRLQLSGLVSLLLLGTEVSAETQSLDAVNVSGTGEYQREDIALSSSSNIYRIEKSAQSGTEVITQEEIEAYQPKDLFDLLNKATGLDLTYQGRKSPFFVNMRGGGSITYIVDGAILPSTSNRILQKLPMAAIEEIQIVRSSTALSLAPTIKLGASNSGSGNNIGFIIIRTKQPKKTQGILSAFYEKAEGNPGANGQSLYFGTTFGSEESLNGYLGGMLSRFDRPSNDIRFDGSDGVSGMVNAGVHYGRFALNLMGYKDEGRFEMQRGVKTDGTVDTAKWYYDPLKSTILSADGSMLWNEKQITLFSLSRVNYEQDEHNEYFDKDNAAHKHYEEKTQTYSLRHNATFGNTFVQLGGQYSQSEGYGPNLSNSFNQFDTSVYGYSLSVEQTLLDGDLVLDAGFRRDQKHIDHSAKAKKEADFEENLEANNKVDLNPANVFALGAVYELDPKHRINVRYMKANEGGGGDVELVTQNGEDLHEENQVRYEVGVEGNYARSFNTMLTYFNVDLKNEKVATDVVYTGEDGNEYYYYTEQDSKREGLELVLNGNINNTTRYKFSWTHMLKNESKTSKGSSDSIGESTPRNIYSALLSHHWNGYTFNLSAKKADPYTSSTSAMGVATNVHLGDYTRYDANVQKVFKVYGLDASAKLYGRNLTDDQYATRYTTGYYYDRGRTIGLELTMSF